MQSLLTNAIEITVISGIGFIGFVFVMGLVERWNRLGHPVEHQPTVETSKPTEAAEAALVEPLEIEATEAIALVNEPAIALDTQDEFISELMSIKSEYKPHWWHGCPVKQLRAVGSLFGVKGSNHWRKSDAESYFMAIA